MKVVERVRKAVRESEERDRQLRNTHWTVCIVRAGGREIERFEEGER